MTKKRILDVTTVKKRDNMLPYTNLATAGAPSTTYSAAPAVLAPSLSTNPLENSPYAFLWCATARDLDDSGGNPNLRINEAQRTSTTPYMKGLKERIEIQLTSGLPWQWRRICFTYKGVLPGSLTTTTYAPYTETSNGWQRVVNTVPGDRNGGAAYAMYELIFAGQNASDWLDPMVAKTDQTRISVKYDKTRTLAAGNERGMVRKYDLYHPMNKTLAYNDDERGSTTTSATLSVDSKVGMGDYYVLDLIRNRYGAASSDVMIFSPHATLYWHEK